MQRAGRESSELLPFLAVVSFSGVSTFISLGPASVLLELLLLPVDNLFSPPAAVDVLTFVELMVFL